MAGNSDGDEAGQNVARLSGVGVTAVGAAWARAAESQRPDRLFDDPIAVAVVERGQRELAKLFSGDEASLERAPFDEQAATAFVEYAAVRTRYFDDCLSEACAAGCRQVVILAAGMDARAFRLLWPAGTRLYELDRPEVLAYKEDMVAAAGVLPRCERHTVAADLAADWITALRAAGFQGGQHTAWLAEGLLNYLTDKDNNMLVSTVGRLSGSGSTLALEVIRASAIRDGPMAAIADRAANSGAPWRSGVDDPAGWLAGHGWRARVDNPFEVAVGYGRQLTGWPGAGPTDDPTRWLVTAARGSAQ
ncbi:MAG: SAM-dependent methyltransferase [Pseudonocardiaceae bacterium]